MNKEQQVALDIRDYLNKVYFGTAEEDIQYRIKYGQNAAIHKVINYINMKYIERGEDNERDIFY